MCTVYQITYVVPTQNNLRRFGPRSLKWFLMGPSGVEMGAKLPQEWGYHWKVHEKGFSMTYHLPDGGPTGQTYAFMTPAD